MIEAIEVISPSEFQCFLNDVDIAIDHAFRLIDLEDIRADDQQRQRIYARADDPAGDEMPAAAIGGFDLAEHVHEMRAKVRMKYDRVWKK